MRNSRQCCQKRKAPRGYYPLTWERLWKAEEGVLGRPEAGGVFDADGEGLCGVTAFLFVLSVSTPRLHSITVSHGSLVVRLAGELLTSGLHK